MGVSLTKNPVSWLKECTSPWTDMEAAMRQASIPLLNLESKGAMAEFHIVGFSLGYELIYAEATLPDWNDMRGRRIHGSRVTPIP